MKLNSKIKEVITECIDTGLIKSNHKGKVELF